MYSILEAFKFNRNFPIKEYQCPFKCSGVAYKLVCSCSDFCIGQTHCNLISLLYNIKIPKNQSYMATPQHALKALQFWWTSYLPFH